MESISLESVQVLRASKRRKVVATSALAFVLAFILSGCGWFALLEEDEYYATKYDITVEEYNLSEPVLISPGGGVYIADTSPPLDWNDVEYAQGYHIQIATNSNMVTPLVVDDSGLKTSRYVVSSLLSNETTYYWRVQAKNVLGIWRDLSEVQFFTVLIATPTVPSPPNGMAIVDSTPLLS